MLIAIAAVSVLAIGAAILAFATGWARGGTPAVSASSPAALSAETQHECITIKREHDNWAKEAAVFKRLTPATQRDARSFALDNVFEDTDAYHKAVTGYQDQASKEHAVAVSTFKFEVSLLHPEIGNAPPPCR